MQNYEYKKYSFQAELINLNPELIFNSSLSQNRRVYLSFKRWRVYLKYFSDKKFLYLLQQL